MNCRDCKHFDVSGLAKRNRTLAKHGHGYCKKHEGMLPMAGCFCADWEKAEEASVKARESFWGSR